MQVVIFHYHLNPGGVTRIIESQVKGLKNKYHDLSIKILTGACPNPDFYNKLNVDVYIDENLNYLLDREFNTEELSNTITYIKWLFKKHSNKSTIIHAHNLNLGKNPCLTLALHELMNQGFSILNHAHDFAEDRPVNMAFMKKIIEGHFPFKLEDIMYPLSNNYFFGVLNQLDYRRLISYNVAEEKISLLANPVHLPETSISANNKQLNRSKIVEAFNIEHGASIITYPVRVIRRKNIGEFILLACLFPNCKFLVTMAPQNPVEIEHYKEWMDFCNKYHIPVIFEAGSKIAFETLLMGSDYCITTSIQEGFGMTYLEPWLMGTPVIGRDIEYITKDLKEYGVNFPFLYQQIKLPDTFKESDFKLLDYTQQKQLIKQVLEDADFKNKLLEENPLFSNFPPEIDSNYILENKKTIEQKFSLSAYAEKLLKLYQTILK